jgi:N-acetyl-gamma-glutamyl-phosphate reductase
MSDTKAIRVAVVGAAGYSGGELLRLLALHPHVGALIPCSRTHAGKHVDQVHTNLPAEVFAPFTDTKDLRWKDCDLVFFATPSGVAMDSAVAALEAGVRVIDVSADFRLRDAQEWAQWYGQKHSASQLLPEAVYGLPEFQMAEIAKARLVANPGCYPVSILLALLPLLEQNCIAEDQIRVSAISGLSGAGRQSAPHYMLTETHSSINAYAASGHRHLPEILQQMRTIKPGAELEFVPHLAPMSRGIHSTIFVDLTEQNMPVAQLHKILAQRYEATPFVQIMPVGDYPRSGDVCGSNLCKIGVHPSSKKGRAVVVSVIDNLIKGAAGIAVQNMNLMHGWKETTGLSSAGMRP